MTPDSFRDAERACPQPHIWSEVYKVLHDAWKSGGCVGEPPPTPIILSGWWYTPALAKIIAWEATVRWAAERSLSHLIPEFTHDEWASVSDAAGVDTPEYSEYRYHDPSPRPSKELLATSLEQLKRAWPLVAEAFAGSTTPTAFTGRKGRRLLVDADFTIKPPWGSWTELVVRKPFRDFRRRVNEAISPHSVDHVDFRRRKTEDDM